MNVIVLGGSGVIGSYVVKCLDESDVFSNVFIGDVHESAAKEICTQSRKTEYIFVDATDKVSLTNSMKDVDIVVNCIGPFYKFAPLILETTIEHGLDYVDVCDDYDTTQSLINDHHERAVAEDVTCIVGLGASPGLTNVIVAYAAKQLSVVHDVKVFVTRGITEKAGAAIPYHMLHCWLGDVPVFKNGAFQKVRGLIDGEEYATFPEPFGQTPVYYFGHPETVTIPRYIEGVNNVCCKGTFFPTEFRSALLQVQALGLLSDHEITVNGHKITPLDFVASYISSFGKMMNRTSPNSPAGGAVMIFVAGEREGIPKTYRFAGTSHMREGTATPAALGAQMIAGGLIKSPGVQAPEACVPPRKFINSLLEEKLFGDIWLTTTEKISGPI